MGKGKQHKSWKRWIGIMVFDSLQDLFNYATRDKYSITDAEWEESKHPRGQPENKGQFASNQLADNIETILHGTRKEKKQLEKRFFTITETPEEYKNIGLKGDKINVQYGRISHHKGKDSDHKFSSDEWRAICKNLSDPSKCIITQSAGRKDFNIYTKLGNSIMVGIEIKHPARDVVSNNLNTIFRRDPKETEKVLYPTDLKNITPAQRSLLAKQNPSIYTADKRYLIMLPLDDDIVKSIFILCKELNKKIVKS